MPCVLLFARKLVLRTRTAKEPQQTLRVLWEFGVEPDNKKQEQVMQGSTKQLLQVNEENKFGTKAARPATATATTVAEKKTRMAKITTVIGQGNNKHNDEGHNGNQDPRWRLRWR